MPFEDDGEYYDDSFEDPFEDPFEDNSLVPSTELTHVTIPAHFDRLLTAKKRSRIEFVGVELEGAWKVPPPTSSILHDGSVCGFLGTSRLHLGEIPSPPMTVDEAESWIVIHYPQHVNSTCGFHVHLSFKKFRYYQQLMNPSFSKAIQIYLLNWGTRQGIKNNHSLMNRLRNGNEYCKPKFYADTQVKAKTKSYSQSGESRYTMVNYPYNLHGTIEVRALEMPATAEMAVSALKEIVNITNTFLCATAKEQMCLRTIEGTNTEDEIEFIEEVI